MAQTNRINPLTVKTHLTRFESRTDNRIPGNEVAPKTDPGTYYTTSSLTKTTARYLQT